MEISEKNKFLLNYSNRITHLGPKSQSIKEYINKFATGMPLCIPLGLDYFNYNKNKIFKLNKKIVASRFFLTSKLNYEGIKIFFEKGNKFTFNATPKKKYINIVKKINLHNIKAKRRVKLLNKKYKNSVCAFQTRNIPHAGHEAIITYLLNIFDHVVVNPIVGPKKKGDIKLKSLKKIYQKLIKSEYKKKVSFLPIYFNMFYAGPREAIHHAIIRKNLGFKNFVVGRDHAGSDNLYRPDQAINYIKKFSKKLKINVLTINGAYYCPECQKVLIKGNCNHENLEDISGTSFRKHLSKKTLFRFANKKIQRYIHLNGIETY
jgi:sulfate adenylyltransferase